MGGPNADNVAYGVGNVVAIAGIMFDPKRLLATLTPLTTLTIGVC